MTRTTCNHHHVTGRAVITERQRLWRYQERKNCGPSQRETLGTKYILLVARDNYLGQIKVLIARLQDESEVASGAILKIVMSLIVVTCLM